MVGEVLEVGGSGVGGAEDGHEGLAETAAVQGVTGEIALQGEGGGVGVGGALQGEEQIVVGAGEELGVETGGVGFLRGEACGAEECAGV